MIPTVTIDCFPESVSLYRRGYAVAAIDVIRATTTAVTSVALGRRCFPAASLEEAHGLAGRMEHPLLAGELAGALPGTFEMNNSPVELALRNDAGRPLILLSSSGTRLLIAAAGCESNYVACFRNMTATARALARHPKVALIGAGSRGEFREEDQACCAWIAAKLMARGHEAADTHTRDLVARWSHANPADCATGNSARYLERSGQQADLAFVLAHIDDVDTAFTLRGGEVVTSEPTAPAEPHRPWQEDPARGTGLVA